MERPNWKMVSRLTDQDLENAFAEMLRLAKNAAQPRDYMTAAQCLALVIENRRAVRQGNDPR